MKPACINPRAVRKALAAIDEGTLTLINEYRQSLADMYIWEVPEELDVPPGYIEDCLFWTGTVGIMPVGGSYALVPGVGEKIDIYGQYKRWMPTPLNGGTEIPLNRKLDRVKYPILQLPLIPAEAISEYAKVQYSAIISAGQNVVAMRQPILIKGQVGKIGIKYAVDMISGGKTYVPVVTDGEGGINREIEVLDLKASNFLDPLTGIIDATDGWISGILGIDSNATQKASGVSIAEVSAMDSRITARREGGLRVRQEWCEKVWNAMGVDISVALYGDYYNGDNGDGDADAVDTDISGSDGDAEGTEEEEK